jgi:hypothetical protein
MSLKYSFKHHRLSDRLSRWHKISLKKPAVSGRFTPARNAFHTFGADAVQFHCSEALIADASCKPVPWGQVEIWPQGLSFFIGERISSQIGAYATISPAGCVA